MWIHGDTVSRSAIYIGALDAAMSMVDKEPPEPMAGYVQQVAKIGANVIALAEALDAEGETGDVMTKTDDGFVWQKPTGGGEGTVKTVNGIEPDESGNVTLDISVEDSEVLDMLIDLNALPAVTDTDGAIYTDENGSILVM